MEKLRVLYVFIKVGKFPDDLILDLVGVFFYLLKNIANAGKPLLVFQHCMMLYF